MKGPAARRRPEAVEQAHIVHLLRSLGWRVYVSGTVRRHGDYQGTMQTPGIPDLEAFSPARSGSTGRTVLKIEVKAKGGRLSDAQREYEALCQETQGRVDHVCGALHDVVAWLTERGYLRADRAGSLWRAEPEP